MTGSTHWQSAGLLLAAHGSRRHPEAAESIRRHAQAIRQRGLFAQVSTAFWQDSPSLAQTARAAATGTTYVVPVFVCPGHFTTTILPRELGLSGGSGGQTGSRPRFVLCRPVGLHGGIAETLAEAAAAESQRMAAPLERTCLLLAAHGSATHPESAAHARSLEARLKANCTFGQVAVGFLEQEPFLARWPDLTTLPAVIVAPVFIGGGHVAELREVMEVQGSPAPGREIRYTAALGEHPRLADMIVDMVADRDAD